MIAALYLDRIAPRYTRQRRRRIYLLLSLLAGLCAIMAHQYVLVLQAASAFFFASYMWKSMLEAMYLSLYIKAAAEGIDYWAAFARQYTLLKAPFAAEALLRLGMSFGDIPEGTGISGEGDDFETYVGSVFANNQNLRVLLEKRGVTKEHWTGVWTWLERREREALEYSLILDDKHIQHIPSIGEAFSYGQTFALSRAGREMSGLSLPQSMEHFYARAFSLLESSLKKSQGSNVIIISQSTDDAEEYVRAFIPHMGKKKFIELDTEMLIGEKDVRVFEKIFTQVLMEAGRAGNIILVIPHSTALIDAGHNMGYDATLALAEYMKNPHLHIMLLADRQSYHATLETNVSIMQAADKIELDAIAPGLLQNIAETEVLRSEYRHQVLFSYQALCSIVDAVVRYGSERMHDTLKDYLDEAALFAKKHTQKKGFTFITDALVKQYIGEKTGTQGTFIDASGPQGVGQPVNIKDILARRVRGQEAAVTAVAQALERVKAGLGSAKRPLGTFLFLGPTGVGKTETAKALAEAYFGNEDSMLRFDMSEFSDAGALARLIGSFEMGEVGMLASKARDAQHGVILFDEIEKANEKVRDLMLQILDEGYFTDAHGGKVNMKNFIMIATSNAGSGEIYDADSRGQSIDKKMLVQHIIDHGIFRPEFLNRFDEIAVFNSLGDRQLASIASLKLAQYADTVYQKKAIHVHVTQALVDFLMDHIENKAFGGREIQRTIQNYVESLIAKDILDGKAQAGSTVSFVYNPEAHSLETVYTVR